MDWRAKALVWLGAFLVLVAAQSNAAEASAIVKHKGNGRSFKKSIARRKNLGKKNARWTPRARAKGFQNVGPKSQKLRTQTLKQESALRKIPTRMSKGPWKHLEWRSLLTQARTRVKQPWQINQGEHELCGPATTLNAIANNNPSKYVELVKEVFSKGTIAGKPIPKRLLETKPDGSIHTLDWMMLTALRAANGRPFQRGQKGASIHSATLPFEIRSWLKTAGYKEVRSKMNVFSRRSHRQIDKLNELMKTPDSSVVILFVRGGFTPNSPHKHSALMKAVRSVTPVHYMRLVSPIVRKGDRVSFSTFDYGKITKFNISQREFGRAVAGTIVGSM